MRGGKEKEKKKKERKEGKENETQRDVVEGKSKVNKTLGKFT